MSFAGGLFKNNGKSNLTVRGLTVSSGVHCETLMKKPIPASALISQNLSMKFSRDNSLLVIIPASAKIYGFMPIVFIYLGIKLVKSTSKLIEPPLVPL